MELAVPTAIEFRSNTEEPQFALCGKYTQGKGK
jgi:hypothetical protein